MTRRMLGVLAAILLGVLSLPAVAAQASGTLSLSPQAVAPGYSPQTVTITDSAGDFTSSSPPPVFVLNGSNQAQGVVSNVTKVSSTELSFTLGSGLTSGTYQVEVEVGSSPYPEATLTVANPSFTISPSQLDVGYSAQTVAVTGTNTSFSGSTTVEVLSGGTQVSGAVTSVVANSQTSLAFTLAAGLAAGTYQVQVAGITGTQNLTVVQPSVSLSLTSVAAGYENAVAVTATGTNTSFSNSTTVSFVAGGTSSAATNVNDTSSTSVGFDLPSGLAAGTYTVKFVTGLEEVDSSFTVTAAPSITISPATLTPGYSQTTVSVTGTDTSFSGATTTVSVSSGGTQYASGVTVTSPSSASFTLAAGLAAGTYTVAVTQSGYPTMDATLQVNATALAFSMAPPSQETAGQSVTLTVAAEQNGVPTTVASPITVNATASGSATLNGQAGSASATITAGSSTTTFTLADNVAETVSLTFKATNYASLSGSVQYVAGSASKLVFLSPPTTTTDAQPVTFTVQAQDSDGNPAVISGSGPTSLTLTAMSGGSADGTLTGGNSGTILAGATSATLTYTPSAPASVSLSASAGALAAATATITVTAGTPSKLVVTPASGTLTSGSDKITLTLEDAQSQDATFSSAKTISLSSSLGKFYADGAMTSQITSVSLPANSSTATVYFGSTQAGTANLIASVSGVSNGTATVTVNLPTFTISPATVDVGYTATTVTVTGQNTTFTTSPPTVTIVNGSGTTVQTDVPTAISSDTSFIFSLKAGLAAGSYTVNISGITQTAALTVVQLSLGFIGTPASTVVPGETTTVQVAAEQNGQPTSVANPLTITATASGSATVNGSANTANATIAAGTSAVTFTIGDAQAETVTLSFTTTSLGYAALPLTITFAQPGSGGGGGGGGGGGTSGGSGGGTASSTVDATGDTAVTHSGATTVLAVDPTELAQTLAGASDEAVQVTTQSSNAQVEVPAAAMTQLVSGKDTLQLDAEGTTLALPLTDGALAAAANALGVAGPDDLTLAIAIAPAPSSDTSLLESKFGANSVLAAPMSFTITATTGGQSITIDSFTAPIARTFTLGAVVDTTTDTGVEFVDGVPQHADTAFQGNTATIYSLTDSTYAVISQTLHFNDIAGLSQAQAIQALADKLVTSGTTSTTFDPKGGVTREQFAALLVRALGLWNVGQSVKFSDISVKSWAAPMIKAAVAKGFIQGYPNGTFKPGAQITNEQMAAMVARVMSYLGIGQGTGSAQPADYGKIPAWARADVSLALSQGIMTTGANGDFDPGKVTTRAITAQIIWNLMQKAGIE